MKSNFSILLMALVLVACTAAPSAVPILSPTPTLRSVPSLTPTSIPTEAPAPTPTPQANVELRFFYDWDPQDPFNLRGTGLNSRRDEGEPTLADFVISYEGQDYTTDANGSVVFSVPEPAIPIMISVPNTNKNVGQKNLADLGIQYTMTLYEPNRVNIGPRFWIDIRDDNCQEAGGRIVCELGMADGYITSPYKDANYLYSSPWTYDSGLSFDKDFVAALENGQVPSPAGGMYDLGALGKLIASYANTRNQGVPYGYPYLINDPNRGILTHMLMDVRNDLGVPIYAPVGGTVCKGNSSDYAICAIDISIDINDIRAIPDWQYGLKVKRGQLIGWADPFDNITGQSKQFPLIHMGNFEHHDRPMTLAHFPFLTPEQIVMGARPDSQGRIEIAPRDQVIADYAFKVQLPHAPVYSGN